MKQIQMPRVDKSWARVSWIDKEMGKHLDIVDTMVDSLSDNWRGQRKPKKKSLDTVDTVSKRG